MTTQQELSEIGRRFGLVDRALSPEEVQQAMLDAYGPINEARDAIGLAVNRGPSVTRGRGLRLIPMSRLPPSTERDGHIAGMESAASAAAAYSESAILMLYAAIGVLIFSTGVFPALLRPGEDQPWTPLRIGAALLLIAIPTAIPLLGMWVCLRSSKEQRDRSTCFRTLLEPQQ